MNRQVIEHDGIPVGIVIPHTQDLLRFIAVKFHVIELDNRVYPTVNALKAEIRRHVSGQTALAA